jgi:biopolymer transport protein ExbB/TolQ
MLRFHSAFAALYQWLTLAGILVTAAMVAADLGLPAALAANDSSHISLIIVLLFIVTSLVAGWRAYRLGRETLAATRLSAAAASQVPLFVVDRTRRQVTTGVSHPPSAAQQHLHLVANKILRGQSACDQSLLMERLENTLGRGHEGGWFIADLMVRLGLLGTVIGFIVMLGSVSDTASVDLAILQQLLGNMTDGMRIALYTTLTGLAAGILLGFQYRLLDRAVDRLMAEIIELSEVHAADQLHALLTE